MGLFGKILDKFNSVNPGSNLSWADRLGAAGGALGGDTSAIDQLRQLAQQRAEKSRLDNVRGTLLSDYENAMAPQYPQAQSIDPSLAGSPDQLPQPEAPDRIQMLRDAFMKAQLQGLDIGDANKTLEASVPDYQVINGGDGAYGIVDPRSGHVQAGQLPNQYKELIEELKRQQIEAAKAQAYQRQQSGVLSAAKAKSGGFAPRQPRTGAKTLPPLPGGKTPVIVSQ